MPAAERGRLPALVSSLSHSRRFALGAAVGVTATGLALGGHAVAGGAMPSPAWLGALTLGAAVTCAVLGQRQWRLPSLLVVLVVTQAGLHAALGGLAGASTQAGPTHASHTQAGHSHAHSHAGHPAMTGFGWQMLAGHLVAVLVTALVIRRGAQICRLLAAVLARSLGIIRVLRNPAPSPPATSAFGRETRRASKLPQLVLCAAPRRGPPVLLAT